MGALAMNKAAVAQQPKAASFARAVPGVLQRKCVCGNYIPTGGECAECAKKGAGLQCKLAIGASNDPLEREADRIADQVMAASEHVAISGGPLCIQRFSGQISGQTTLPASVERTVADSGQPLESSLENDMGRRFGYDFSHVRVHADTKAARSARDVNARAYTVGHDIVFGESQFASETSEGRRLIAHELTHVVQQEKGLSADSLQRQERRPRPAPVDANAQRIIDLAQDNTTPVGQRSVAVVQAIIDQYFPGDASKVSQIKFRADEPGLKTTFVGSGSATTGALDVGNEFVMNTTQAGFARRVLQVRHEIEHIDQVGSGTVGETRSDEREFIAFYHEALAQELPGTGRMQHSTRVQLVDGALGYYHCLSSELQDANSTRRDELVARRVEDVRRSGRTDLGEVPTSCRRAPGDRGSSGGTESGGLSGGAIAGIVLGSVVGAAAIGLGIAALAGAF